jgi:hypothetical protein
MKVLRKANNPSVAYRCGWIDGRYGKLVIFTENRRLAEWGKASERLDYYGGHRVGWEARQLSNRLGEGS